jgi:hypothetical protein
LVTFYTSIIRNTTRYDCGKDLFQIGTISRPRFFAPDGLLDTKVPQGRADDLAAG